MTALCNKNHFQNLSYLKTIIELNKENEATSNDENQNMKKT